MPGNEIEVVKYLVKNKGNVILNHLGNVIKISSPTAGGVIEICDIDDIEHVHADDARKKADIFINDIGISIKQTGGSNAFNRLQRSGILEVFTELEIANPASSLSELDELIQKFHNGSLKGTRNRCWSEALTEFDFKKLVRYLMMKGSPNYGKSNFPAALILTAPGINISENNITVYTFDEYFERYKDSLKLSLRRSRIGQLR